MLTIKLRSTEMLAPGIWRTRLSPTEVARISDGEASRIGPRSILNTEEIVWDPSGLTLDFPLSKLHVLCIGSTDEVVVFDQSVPDAGGVNLRSVRTQQTSIVSEQKNAIASVGDTAFLKLTKSELSERMANVAEELLRRVRERHLGELKRGKSKNFSETPDNFWYVIVQPRIDQLSITVRGDVQHFSGVGKLPIKDDRGNTLFKVTKMDDVSDAISLIFHAKRRKV